MQASEFTIESPGRLVPTERGAVAFVPDPAPERLALSGGTLAALTRAERALGQLTGTLRAAGRHVSPQLVNAPLAREEAIASSRIEGTNTTPEQLVLLEIEPSGHQPEERGRAQTREVLNYLDALGHGFKRLAELPVSLRMMKELHAILLRGVRGNGDRPGEFRDVQNFIGATQDIRQTRFVPPPVSEMHRCLDELERYINSGDDELPHLVRLAVVHYQFEAIHPFRDGNGRVGRLLIPLLLCAYERLETPVLYMSSYLERSRTEYTDRLLQVSRTGDVAGWVQFFLRAVEGSANEAISRAEAMLKLRDEYHGRLHSARSSALLLKLVDALFERPSISISGAAGLLSVTPASAAANLRKLVEAKIVEEVTGRRREQRFVAREILGVSHRG